MPRGVKQEMNFVLAAREHCANWDTSRDDCVFAPTTNIPECLLKRGERCGYFERAVLPGIKTDSEATFHYKQMIEQNKAKMAQNTVGNKALTKSFVGGVLPTYSESNLTQPRGSK